MFRIPAKQLIVNSDSQLRILKYDGSATYVDITTPALATDGFQLEGFLSMPILFGNLVAVTGATLIKSTASSAGTKQVATWTFTGTITGAAAAEPFRVKYSSLNLAPTEFQNQPLEKHYQVSATLPNNATASQYAQSVKAAINADPNAPVTVSGGAGVLTFTAKQVGVEFTFYALPQLSGGLASLYLAPTFAVTTPAALPAGTYDDLINKNWAKGDHLGSFDFDRNAEVYPQFGATYTAYRFKIKSTPLMDTNLLIPNDKAVAGEVVTEFVLYINDLLTSKTTMDLVVADANAAA